MRIERVLGLLGIHCHSTILSEMIPPRVKYGSHIALLSVEKMPEDNEESD